MEIESHDVNGWASAAGRLRLRCEQLEAEVTRLKTIESRFLSLVIWDRLPPAATDTVWIEPGRSVTPNIVLSGARTGLDGA